MIFIFFQFFVNPHFLEVHNLKSKPLSLFLVIFLSLVFSNPIHPASSYSDANCDIGIYTNLNNVSFSISYPTVWVVTNSSDNSTYYSTEAPNSTSPSYPVPSFSNETNSITSTETNSSFFTNTLSTPTYPFSFNTGWDNFTYDMFFDEMNYYHSLDPSIAFSKLSEIQYTFSNATFFVSTIVKTDVVLPNLVLHIGSDSFNVKANESLTFSYNELLNRPVFLYVTLNYNFKSNSFHKMTPIEFLIDLAFIFLPLSILYLFYRLKRKFYPSYSVKKVFFPFLRSLKILMYRLLIHKKNRNSLENIISLVEDILEESTSNGGKIN